MGFTEGQLGHLAKHDDIDALTATHTSQIASGDVTDPASAASISLSATLAASTVGPVPASAAVQGLYSRTFPTPSPATGGITVLAKDPSIAGRLWAQREGTIYGSLGYTDDNGDTWTLKVATPAGGTAGTPSMKFSGAYVFITQGPGSTARDSSLWRSPAPDANGDGLVFTKIFDLAAPPAGITTGDASIFKGGCLDVNGANVYLLEYSLGTGASTGGPQLYHSPDYGATWYSRKQWANCKHGHDVRVINAVPWVTLGDPGPGLTDLGLWSATNASATTWIQRNLFGEEIGGNTCYGIGFIPITISGIPMIAIEADGNRNFGPLFYPSQDLTGLKSIVPAFTMPITNLGSMRCLTLTSDGNLMWLHTGEGGSIGPMDSVCISRGPDFSVPIVLETMPSTTSNAFAGGRGTREPIENGDYIWIGANRIRKEKFLGQ